MTAALQASVQPSTSLTSGTRPADPSVDHTLDQLATGSSATLLAVRGEAGIRRRLLEMGLCPGMVVEVLRRAPLGDPIELRVRGYLLSVRADQARLITISPISIARIAGP